MEIIKLTNSLIDGTNKIYKLFFQSTDTKPSGFKLCQQIDEDLTAICEELKINDYSVNEILPLRERLNNLDIELDDLYTELNIPEYKILSLNERVNQTENEISDICYELNITNDYIEPHTPTLKERVDNLENEISDICYKLDINY